MHEVSRCFDSKEMPSVHLTKAIGSGQILLLGLKRDSKSPFGALPNYSQTLGETGSRLSFEICMHCVSSSPSLNSLRLMGRAGEIVG